MSLPFVNKTTYYYLNSTNKRRDSSVPSVYIGHKTRVYARCRPTPKQIFYHKRCHNFTHTRVYIRLCFLSN